MSKIKISGDSTIDLSEKIADKYNVNRIPLYITLGDDSKKDGVEISPDDIYSYVSAKGVLPKTSAVSVDDYITEFKKMREEYDEVIHFNISSDFSSTYQNALIASKEVDGVYPIDSRNLSTGTGLLVLEACEMLSKGLKAKEIISEIDNLIPKVESSFIINRLDYLYKGGRCSGVVALGANVLKLRPVILVKNGQMEVGKRFRGSYDDCMVKYIESKLSERDDIRLNRIFITHTKCDENTCKLAEQTVKKLKNFNEILDTTAGCTVTTHCGEGTLGVLFIRK